jgi:hypothetical protein
MLKLDAEGIRKVLLRNPSSDQPACASAVTWTALPVNVRTGFVASRFTLIVCAALPPADSAEHVKLRLGRNYKIDVERSRRW